MLMILLTFDDFMADVLSHQMVMLRKKWVNDLSFKFSWLKNVSSIFGYRTQYIDLPRNLSKRARVAKI